MKSRTTNVLMLAMIGMMLVFAFAPLSNAASHSYKYENFGTPDADTVNPYSASGEIAYAYAEHGWAGGTAAVDASGHFYLNTSTTGVDGSANFTLNSSAAYDYFEFRFLYLNDWTDPQNHSSINFIVAGSTGTICTIQVFGANTTVGGSANRIKVLDYSDVEVANESIAKDKWYTVRVNPDYDAWDLNAAVTVYDVAGGVYTITTTTIGLGGNSDISKFYMTDVSTEKACITVDNLMLLTTTLSQGESTTNYLGEYIIPILFATAMLSIIISMVFSGGLDPKMLITVTVVAVVGFVVLMIITSI